MALATTLMAVGIPAEQANRLGYEDRVPLDGNGTTQAGATEIIATNTNVALGTSPGDTAFILPADAEYLQPYFVLNTTADAALIFPPVGDTIDAKAVDAAVQIDEDLARVFQRVEEGRWVSFPAGEAGGGAGDVVSVVAGTGISVDSTDPANPVVSNTGVLSVTAGSNITIGGTAQNPTAAVSDSPALTGTPTAPTAPVDTNTTQIATTAMVLGQAASATPLGDNSTPAVGISTRYARADHVHPGREQLTANRSYFVATTGSNSNNGLTVGSPFLTIQKALDVVAALDISIYNVTINVADGTYTGNNLVTGPWVGTGNVTVVGNTTTPANVIVDPPSGYCFFANAGARLTLSGMETGGSVGVQAQRGGSIIVGAAMRFGATTAFQMYADFGGSITITNNYSIVGGAIAHIEVGPNSLVYGTSLTITLTGTPAFSAFFADVNGVGAGLTYFLNTFSGSATGARYRVKDGGVINTNGAGATYLPGNAGGTGTNFSASPWGLYS